MIRNRWSRSAAVLGIVVTALATLGCGGGETETVRSIDEIQAEEGVPVSVRALERTTFRRYLSFTSTLTGAAESTASSMLSDTVAGVLYQVGDYVEKDTAVVLFPPDNPSLNYEQARVSYESARTALERVRQLYEDDGISQQAYDDARTQFELARANWNAVQNMARVKAPIAGYITRLNVLESDNVAPGDPLFTVADLTSLKTTVWLTDRQVRSVQVGQPAVARWQDIEISGEVVQVDLAMDQDRKAFAAKIRFENTDLAINSGVTAVVEIETYRNDDALILNQREIVDDGAGTYVYTVRDGTAVRRSVEVLNRQGLIAEVAIENGDDQRVITRGIEQVGDGMRVRVINEDARLVQR
jgi:RND family efflux transporter MFP subunit